MHVVYQLVNSKGQIEYVGNTKNPNTRLSNHICINGTFAGRKDLSLEIIKSGFSKEKTAFDYQCKIQKKLGFETDREKWSRNMKEVQKKTTEQQKIPIIAYDLLGNEIGRFSSITETANNFNLHTNLVWLVVNNKQKSTKGFVFKPLENI
jgi:predicted GIY-YIG superfamily endonuclease